MNALRYQRNLYITEKHI